MKIGFIKKNKKKKLMVRGIKNNDYPTAFLFLEIVRDILNRLNVHLDQESYLQYLKLGYPFEKYES